MDKKTKKAIKAKNFQLYYQPIYSYNFKNIVKYEALLRLKLEDEEELLQPHQFLTHVDSSDTKHLLPSIVLSKVIKKLSHCSNNVAIALNFSYEDIENNSIREELLKIIEQNKSIVQGRLIFEFVETKKIMDFLKIGEFIKKISDFGVVASIDDFGMEHSNFYALSLFPFKFLKIDGHFIQDLTNDKSKKIVSSIVELCKKLDIKTIAEHIEDEKLYNVCKELGVDHCQGYYLSKPLPDIV